MFTTEGNTLDLQANDILFANICQYDEDGLLTSVDVDFDRRHPNEPCYVTFDSRKPLYVRLTRDFYGLNEDISEYYYKTLVLNNKYMLVPNFVDIEHGKGENYEVYVVNGLDVNNRSLLLQLDNKHDNLYLDLITFTYCDIPVDLRNIKDAKVDSNTTRILVRDETNGIRYDFEYKNYVYTSSMRVYNKNNNAVIDLNYRDIYRSSLVYNYRLKFTNKTSNYAELLDVRNTPSTVSATKDIAFELQGSEGPITDLGRFMVEFAQYTYEGVREVCVVDYRKTVSFDRSRPLYAEGIPESNYFNKTLIRYGLAVFRTNLNPPYPCVVNPSSVYGSDAYTSINVDTDVQDPLVVSLKALPFVVVHLDFTSFSDLGSTVDIKVQLDGYDAWTDEGYKVSTSSDLLLAFYPSDEDITKYFNISVKLGDGSYQLYHRYSFNSNVAYDSNTNAVIVE